MNRRLAEIENKPSFVGDIVMENVDLTEATPLVQPIKLLKPKAPYEIRAECDVVYNGGFTCTVRTTVLGVNVAMTVTLDHLSGRVLFICPSGMDPICTLSFRQQPYTKFSVVPAVASRRMRHLPAVSGYIVQALTRIVATDTVLPNGICFHIPLKSTMTTSGRNMDLSTIRKVRSRLQKEEMSRLERLQQEAAAEFADRAAERAAAERITSHGSVDDFEHLADTSSSSSSATPAAASSAAASAAASTTKSVLSSSASSGVPSAAAAAATPLSSSSAAANKSASAGSAAKTAEAAHREQSGGGWGVGALIGAVGSKVKEARQRQLARAAAELEKEREKRQKLAEDRKERERLREAEAARRKASGIVDSHETASASTGAGASEAHAHGAASAGLAASAHAIAVNAAAEHSDGGDSHDSHDDEVFDGEKHAELAKEVEAVDLRASKLPAASDTSSAASPPLTLESVDISDPLAQVADPIPSLPPKRPTSKSADKPLVDAETNALLDLAAAAAADKPRAPSPAPVADAAPARPVSPRPAEAVVRPVSPQPVAAVARPASPQPTEAVLSSASAERVASPKLPSPRPAEPAAVVDVHTVPAAVPVERVASPKPPSPRVPEPSVAAAPTERAPSPAPTPARSVSPKPADAATSHSLHPPRTESPKPELPPKHHEPVPRAASPKPALPAKERKLSSERTAATAEAHAEPTPALHSDGSPVRPESPKPSLPPKSAAAVHKIVSQSDAPPTPQRPALPPKGEHAKLHEAHEPAPMLPPKSSDAKRRSLEFAAPPVVASEMKKGGSFESLSAAVPPSDRHEAGGAKSRETPRLQFDVPAAEPAAAAAASTAPAPAIDAHEHVEPLLSPRASDEHNASDNESDWEGLSFEVGSTTADALGSGAEDIDLLADSIFGNTTSPTTTRAAKSTALFPGLSGTASIPGNAAPSTSPPRTGMVGKAIGGAARLVKGGKTLVKRTIVDLGDLDDLFGPSHSTSSTTRTRANATAAPPVAGATPATPGKSASKPLDDDDDIFGENLVGEVTTNAASVSSSGKQSKLKSLLTRRKPTTADK
jgi:hypothetical protein